MLPRIIPEGRFIPGGGVDVRCGAFPFVFVVADWSDAQEQRIIPITGRAKAKISFFIIEN
jgi:hypothetical protein